MSDTALAVIDPAVEQQLKIVTSAIQVALGVKELTTDFNKRRDSAIEIANEFEKPPETDAEQEDMLRAQRSVAALRIEVTKQAEAFKAPLNAARTKIIDLVKSGIAPLEQAERRLEGFVQHRQQLLLRQQQEQAAAAERERQRIANEAAEAQRLADEAEKKRQEAEASAANAEKMKGQKKEQAEADSKRLAEEAQRLEDEAFAKSLAAEMAPEPVAAPVSESKMAREVLDFELAGNNVMQKHQSLLALTHHHPELFSVTIHEETPRGYSLTLKVRDVVDKLNGDQPAFQTIPAAIKVTTKLTKLR